MKPAVSDFTQPRQAALTALVANLALPETVDFLEPPDRVLEIPKATGRDELTEVVNGFLDEHYSTGGQTADTYASALAVYLPWCASHEVDPLLITRTQASGFARWLRETPSEQTRRPRSPSRRSGILSACTGLLEYAVDAGARPEWTRNAFSKVKRPKVERAPKVAQQLTATHVNQLILAARQDHLLGGVLGKLIIVLLAWLGLRPGDICRLNADAAADDGPGVYRLDVPAKGGKVVSRWLTPKPTADLVTYVRRVRVEPDLELRPDADGIALLVHPGRRCRLNTDDLLRLVRRAAARAGLPFAESLCARDFRPWMITTARALGVPLEDRSEAAGHAHTSTTERYDQTQRAREHEPALRLATLFDDYPAEEYTGVLADQLDPHRRRPPRVQDGCDCTPMWPQLLVDLTPVGVDQLAEAVPTERHEPGTHQLAPYCRRCRVTYVGPFRVARVLDDPDQEWLARARAAMTEAALYPDATQRRDERRRRNEEQ